MEFLNFTSTSAIIDALTLVFQVAHHFQMKSTSLDKQLFFLSLRSQYPAFSEGSTPKGFPPTATVQGILCCCSLGHCMVQWDHVKLTFPPCRSCWGWKGFTLIRRERPFTDPQISLGSSHFGQMQVPFVFLLPFIR